MPRVLHHALPTFRFLLHQFPSGTPIKSSFVLGELSTISKRLEGSGYKVGQITGGSSSRNEYFKVLIKKDTSVVNILKRRDRTN